MTDARLAAVRALAQGWLDEPAQGRAARQRRSCGAAVLRALGDDVSIGSRPEERAANDRPAVPLDFDARALYGGGHTCPGLERCSHPSHEGF